MFCSCWILVSCSTAFSLSWYTSDYVVLQTVITQWHILSVEGADYTGTDGLVNFITSWRPGVIDWQLVWRHDDVMLTNWWYHYQRERLHITHFLLGIISRRRPPVVIQGSLRVSTLWQRFSSDKKELNLVGISLEWVDNWWYHCSVWVFIM